MIATELDPAAAGAANAASAGTTSGLRGLRGDYGDSALNLGDYEGDYGDSALNSDYVITVTVHLNQAPSRCVAELALPSALAEQVAIERIIGVGKESASPAVAALSDMVRVAGNDDLGGAGHAVSCPISAIKPIECTVTVIRPSDYGDYGDSALKSGPLKMRCRAGAPFGFGRAGRDRADNRGWKRKCEPRRCRAR